jgi:hypothetical protein
VWEESVGFAWLGSTSSSGTLVCRGDRARRHGQDIHTGSRVVCFDLTRRNDLSVSFSSHKQAIIWTYLDMPAVYHVNDPLDCNTRLGDIRRYDHLSRIPWRRFEHNLLVFRWQTGM